MTTESAACPMPPPSRNTGPATPRTPPVNITIYRWAGQWGPFKVKVPCGECALTLDIVRDTLETELAGIPATVETHEWLSEWWKSAFKGGWHAPIVMVDGRIVSQGEALNRGILAQAVVNRFVERAELAGNHVFGKDHCGHCSRAKDMLAKAGVAYTYHDVVRNPRAVYEMVTRTKRNIGGRTPVTTPQVWLDGRYIGGADQLAAHLARG